MKTIDMIALTTERAIAQTIATLHPADWRFDVACHFATKLALANPRFDRAAFVRISLGDANATHN